MGVEYKHFLIPENPSFVPATGVIIRMDNLLDKWKLKAGSPKIYNLSPGERKVEAPLHSLIFGQGFGIKYPSTETGMPVASIMGPSYYGYDVHDDDRYIQSIKFVVGLDFRIHPGDQEMYISVIKPPFEGQTPLQPYWESDDILFTHAEAYKATLSTTPPEVDIEVADRQRLIGQQNFLGYWRTALIIDCGKDLPKLGDELFTLPDRTFVNDVEEVLGCKVIEIGSAG